MEELGAVTCRAKADSSVSIRVHQWFCIPKSRNTPKKRKNTIQMLLHEEDLCVHFKPAKVDPFHSGVHSRPAHYSSWASWLRASNSLSLSLVSLVSGKTSFQRSSPPNSRQQEPRRAKHSRHRNFPPTFRASACPQRSQRMLCSKVLLFFPDAVANTNIPLFSGMANQAGRSRDRHKTLDRVCACNPDRSRG